MAKVCIRCGSRVRKENDKELKKQYPYLYAIRINDTKELSCEKWRVSMG